MLLPSFFVDAAVCIEFAICWNLRLVEICEWNFFHLGAVAGSVAVVTVFFPYCILLLLHCNIYFDVKDSNLHRIVFPFFSSTNRCCVWVCVCNWGTKISPPITHQYDQSICSTNDILYMFNRCACSIKKKIHWRHISKWFLSIYHVFFLE